MSSDRESGISASGGKWYPDSGDRVGKRHRRAMRRIAIRLQRLSAGESLWEAVRFDDAKSNRGYRL